ncbi:MAG: hypothetical protein PHZ24_09045 [Bacteroidales bacterium]|nr:hypothetical protein [Bacteroidales bacterium]
MESFYASLYIDIMERIKAKVPEINWIEQDFGQDVIDKWRPNVLFPALLIDFSNSEYEGESESNQFANVTVRIRLLVAPFTQSYEGAPVEVIEKALNYFDVENNVVRALHNWHPTYCQPLIRVRASSQNRGDIGLRIRTIDFATSYEEEFEEDNYWVEQ